MALFYSMTALSPVQGHDPPHTSVEDLTKLFRKLM